MKSKEQKEKQTAVEYLKSIDETINIMESIQDVTAQEQEVLIESRNKTSYTDDEGVFKMESLMDVDIQQNSEENTPQLWNEPVEDLDDTDKSLIADEFVNMVKNWQSEVIDFSDIGPVATVIQDKLGYRQPIEGFLSELINTAVEKQDSQAFAHGDQAVPGLKGRTDEMAEDGGPADVGPETVSPSDAAPMDDAPMDIDPAAELAPEMGDELAPEMGDELAPEMGDELAPEMGDDELAPEMGDDELAPEMGDDELAPEMGEASDEVAEEVSEEAEEDDDEDEDDIDFQLEAIKTEYIAKDKNKKIDVQLEAIKADLLKPKVEAEEAPVEEEAPAEEAQVEGKLEAVLESISKDFHKKEDAKVESVTKEKKLNATLESIANNYHNGEKVKVESVTKEKKLNATLESIANTYHKTEKAKVEVIEKEQKLNATLESLVESYHKGEKKAKVENAEARTDTKAKIEKLSKLRA